MFIPQSVFSLNTHKSRNLLSHSHNEAAILTWNCRSTEHGITFVADDVGGAELLAIRQTENGRK